MDVQEDFQEVYWDARQLVRDLGGLKQLRLLMFRYRFPIPGDNTVGQWQRRRVIPGPWLARIEMIIRGEDLELDLRSYVKEET